jgi:ATP-dependent exoDNAse (exonuclease V) beta subunit
LSTQVSPPAAGSGPTEEQRQAITRRRGPLLLAAGAGSGKTSVLVERFVEAVRCDGITPARILAITFTDRAAAELRQRIRERLLELGERHAATELEGAFVATFHGFCVRVLRSDPLRAGLDPDFTILEEGLAGRLRASAFAQALEGFLADGGEQALELLAAYGAERTQSMILDVYGELRSRGQREPALAVPRPRLDVEMTRAELERALAGALSDVQQALSERPGPRLEGAFERLAYGAALLGPGSSAPSVASQRALERAKLPGASSGVLADEACQLYRQALAEYARACAELHGAQTCGVIGELLRRFAASYEQLKRSRGTLDFDDLELCARDLLRANDDLRSSWAERFELLMVDEFQDSNQRQLEILAALERANLCTVGDEFQSIYGFRHADVRLFRARRQELTTEDRVLTLARNFRGRPELLDVVNAVFCVRFGEQYTPLIAGREDPASLGDDGPLTELLLTDKQGWEQAHGFDDEAPPTQAWRWAEARLLAQRIAELIDSGQARAADIVVLLRSLGDAEVYERSLERHGIQTIAAVGGFWRHQQVEDLIAYLRALCNPLDALALYGALASPLAGLSSDSLALLAQHARLHEVSLWETITDPGSDHCQRLCAQDRVALAGFLEHFTAERSSPGRPLAQLIERVVLALGYDEHVLRLQGANRRLANIHKLQRIARQFESSEGRDLRALLDHIEHLRSSREASEPDAPVADEALDAVRLMSIHAAKGLEFPVVCVADLGRGGNSRMADLLLGEDDGDPKVGLQLVGLDGSAAVGALDFDELRHQRLLREAQEEERIIYVAMTRARERLLLSGAADFANWPQEKPLAASICWLAPALVEDLQALLADPQAVSDEPVPGTGLAHVRCWLNTPTTLPRLIEREHARERSTGGAPRPAPAHETPATPQGELAGPRPVFASERSLSYSTLAQFERCGYGYYLRHVLGLPEDRTAPTARPASEPGIHGRARGLIVHRLLEAVDFSSFTRPSAGEVSRAARELSIDIDAAECEQLAQFLAALAGSELALRLADAESVAREQPFAFSMSAHEPIFTGVLDTVARERDGGWLVVDYKSDHLTAEQDLERLVESEYSLQRLLYGIAALRAGAPHVSVVHWLLERPAEPVGVRYTQQQISQLEQELTARIGRMRAASYAVSERPHRELCMTCPGRRGLCSWPEERTLAPLSRSPDG